MRRRLKAILVSAGIGLACYLVSKYSFLFSTVLDPELDLVAARSRLKQMDEIINPREDRGMWCAIVIVGARKGKRLKDSEKYYCSEHKAKDKIPPAKYKSYQHAWDEAQRLANKYRVRHNLEDWVFPVVVSLGIPDGKDQKDFNEELYNCLYDFKVKRVLPLVESEYWVKAVLSVRDPDKRRTIAFRIYMALLEKECKEYKEFISRQGCTEERLQAGLEYCFGQVYMEDSTDAQSAS